MPWFMVDDKLHSHRKIVRAGVQAMGLWVIAGSWCADQLENGFIPHYIADRIDRDAETHAAELVSAGLWEVAEKDGEQGWLFHNWAEFQPTREAVEAKREAARERMARVRGNRKSGSQEVRANSEGTSQEVRLTPALPNPSLPDKGRDKRGTRIPDDFSVTDDMRSWAKDNGFDRMPLDAITEEFFDFWRGVAGQKGVKLDWVATWRNWIRRKSEDTVRPLRPGQAAPRDQWARSVIVGGER